MQGSSEADSGQNIGTRCDCIEIIRVQGDIEMNKNIKLNCSILEAASTTILH